MRLLLLGPLELRDGDGRPIPPGGRRVGLLLARLALTPAELVPTGTLIADLWEDEPPAAGGINALHRLVSRARRALHQAGHDDVGVVSGPGGYTLAVGPSDVDVHRFERLAAEGRRLLRAGTPEQAASVLREALSLWRGPVLPEFADVGFAGRAAARLEELRLAAVEDHIEVRLQPGRAPELLSELYDLTTAHPLRERATGLLMRALQLSGSPAEALAAYERLRAALADELGAVPSAELRRLHAEALTDGARRGAADAPGGSAGARPRSAGPGAPAAAPAPSPGAPASSSGTPAPAGKPGLPSPITRFVGRAGELQRVATSLRGSRLVTLYGPGGVGKTRLATEFASRADSDTADLVRLVELAGLRPGDDLPDAVARALGLPGTPLLEQSHSGRSRFDRLTAFLSARRVLLVLDNCEHLITEVSRFAAELLAACPRLLLLATSREPLMITGEAMCRVGPLHLPSSEAEAEHSTAVQLFCDRAALVSPGFALTPANAAQVVEICRKLDGLPLAIELAAARLRSMSLRQITERLDDRFRLLAAGNRTTAARHRTLRATMDWSWALLTEPERALARRLSAAGNGVTQDAAVAVGVGAGEGLTEEDVPYVLSSLVDRSLLHLWETEGGEMRYRMHETTRAYCAERLAEAGERESAEAACTRHFLELAEHAAGQLRGAGQPRWIARLDADHDNVLLALRRAVDGGDVDTAVRLGLALSWYWVMRGRYTEANSRCAELMRFGARVPEKAAALFTALRLLLPAPAGRDPDGAGRDQGVAEAARRARDCDAMGEHPLLALLEPKCWQLAGEHEEMERSARRACAHPDAWARASGRAALGFAAETAGDVGAGERHLRAALESFRELGDQWSTGQLTSMLSRFASLRGDTGGTLALLHEAQAAIEAVGSADDIAQIRVRLGFEQLRSGEYNAAEVSFRSVLRGPRRTMPEYEVLVAAGLAELATRRGQPSIASARLERARRLLDDTLIDKEYLHIEVLRRTAALELSQDAGDVAAARSAAAGALRLALPLNDMWVLATVAELLAVVTLHEGGPERAARLLGTATALRGLADLGSPEVRALDGELTARLGAEEFRRVRAEGERLSREEAVRALVAAV
ncbi:AAA family ATPase [Streptomyces sudanensis]|uniref:AfsR/SARP family transcriptional regulator n=1 Tax=Streptomyces sudanensis TaxID=436397 RepID=UPI0020CD3ADE|nr:BTAD domain-containing putative transcriptional regulator [Streptomyces sudanensis]MCP9986085.1 AAA family ATPase [Streptomyces sudanensis]